MEYDLAFDLGDASFNNEFIYGGTSADPGLFYSTAYLTIPFNPDPLIGTLSIDLPLFSDTDHNGLIDFLEVAKAVPGNVTSGGLYYDNGFETFTGTVSATWTRTPGATTGLVSLRVKIADFGVDTTFKHTFEIYQYKGTLTYTNTATGALSSVSLNRLGATGAISGPLNLVRTNSATLGFPAGTWKDETGASLEFSPSADTGVALHRDSVANHFGAYVAFVDGMPQTAETQEYQLWRLDVFDANDANLNGVPDLGDTPVAEVAPTLAVNLQDGSLRLAVTAKKGQTVTVESSPNVVSPSWTTVTTLTLAADTDSTTLAVPASTVFFRTR
jgi:hypothetical protein